MTAGASDFLVGKGRHQFADDVREEHGVGIAEHEYFALRQLFEAIQHGRLAGILRGLHERYALVRIACDNFGSLVGGTVVTDKHLEFFLGVVYFQDVLDLALDNRLFVIGRNQQGHLGQFARFRNNAVAALEELAHERQRKREKAVAEEQQKDERPERDLQIEYHLVVHRSIHSFSFWSIWYNNISISCASMESVTVNIERPFGAISTKAGKADNSQTSK